MDALSALLTLCTDPFVEESTDSSLIRPIMQIIEALIVASLKGCWTNCLSVAALERHDVNEILRQREWWRHQMENIFRVTGHLCGQFFNSSVMANSPHKGQWRRALMYSLIYACINAWVNNLEASGLRHHRAHNDVSVMDCLRLRSVRGNRADLEFCRQSSAHRPLLQYYVDG